MSDVVDKIRKLMALADKAGTPEEAELAFAKAQELMVKHAIDEANLRSEGHTVDSEPIVVHVIHLGKRDEIKAAKMLLYVLVGQANQCRVLDATKYRDEVHIVGHKSSAEFVEMLVANILIQYAGERTKAWKEYQARYKVRGMQPPESRFKWVNGFAWGYAQRIGERLKETSSTTATKSKGGELALRDKSALVDDWMRDNMRVGKGRSLRNRSSWESRGMGRTAANKADISGGRNNVGVRAGRAINR